MRILYGVQATGQGHISRARAMAEALAEQPVEVTWLFSGRAREGLFDMQPFGDFLHRDGLSFATEAGRIRYRRTVASNNVFRFIRDVRGLDLSHFDLVVTDFEPVTAWAGRRAGKRTIGIGHQYAFGDSTPRAQHGWIPGLIMQHFAPASMPLGLHWHPYADNVLPPILDLPELDRGCDEHVLVYLPFEDQDEVTRLLQEQCGFHFVQYAPGLDTQERGNVTRCKPSIAGFKQHLSSSRGVICNSGFELISECLFWGKPVLTRPLHGQLEQQSNALALEQLGYAQTCQELSPGILSRWLRTAQAQTRLPFADVAAALATWLADGARVSPAELSRELWRQTFDTGLPDVQASIGPAKGSLLSSSGDSSAVESTVGSAQPAMARI